MRERHEGQQFLHCVPWQRDGYADARLAREPIYAALQPVYGYVRAVSLGHSCLAAGLFDDVRGSRPLSPTVLSQLARERWGGSVERFLADAEAVGGSLSKAAEIAAGLRGAVIGWAGATNAPQSRNGTSVAYCPDLNLTLAILGRRVGGLFIAARAPDYSWENLFDAVLEFDDDLVPAAHLEEEPWVRFPWQKGGKA